jgi:hypothetical protein
MLTRRLFVTRRGKASVWVLLGLLAALISGSLIYAQVIGEPSGLVAPAPAVEQQVGLPGIDAGVLPAGSAPQPAEVPQAAPPEVQGIVGEPSGVSSGQVTQNASPADLEAAGVRTP